MSAMGNRPVESMDREKAFTPFLQSKFLDFIEIDYVVRPASARSMTESELSAAESFVDTNGNLRSNKHECYNRDQLFQQGRSPNMVLFFIPCQQFFSNINEVWNVIKEQYLA